MAETGTDIGKASDILRSGGLVAIPTETVYGLAANALDKYAVAKIFAAKNRPFFDPLIVHISGVDQLEMYAREIPETAKELCRKIWPGPLTVILKKAENIPELVTAGSDTVGLRVPNHGLTLSLLQQLDFPLAAPSANPFGYISPTTAEHVHEQLGDKIDYILDGGPSSIGIESTIVRFTDGTPQVLRLGGTAPEILRQYLGEVREILHQTSNPSAPGQLDKHYAPKTKMFLLKLSDAIPDEALNARTALIRFQDYLTTFPKEDQYILSPQGNSEEAAANLFEVMHQLDSEKYDCIVAEEVPETGLGRAINDRLRRAAAR